MQIKNNKSFTLCAHAALSLLLTAGTAQAIDTDVYLNKESNVLPNVMFSIDTSASMLNESINAPKAFDITTDYTEIFDVGKVYISTDGRIPKSPNDVPSVHQDSVFGVCDYSNPVNTAIIEEAGFGSIRAAIAFTNDADVSYAKNRWFPATKVAFNLSVESHVKIECEDDFLPAGKDSNNNYAKSGSGGLYTTIENEKIDWKKFPFVTVYLGKYLNYRANPGYEIITRDELQQRIVRDAIIRTPDIIAGLTRMQNDDTANYHYINGEYYHINLGGGTIIRGLKNNSIRENQNSLIASLKSSPANLAGWTPLAGTLLEILHYYHGKPKLYHHDSSNYTDSSIMNTDGNYKNPITSSCQKNYVILVTDGEPSSDALAIRDFKSSNSSTYPKYNEHTGVSSCTSGSGTDPTNDSDCLVELSEYLSKKDASPKDNIYDLDGDGAPDPQTVKVYPVGMELELDLLTNAAIAAGTESFYANDAAKFEEAFIEILATIKESKPVSMVTASSSNNRFTKTSNREFLYYGQFVPSNDAQWRGNLKKYRYAYHADGTAYITDSDEINNPDITTTDGGTINSAKSYWSSSADGNNALKGGVAGRLKSRSSARVIRGINKVNSGGLMANNNVDIFKNINKLNINNLFYKTEVNAEGRSEEERKKIKKHALGKDVHDEDGDGNKNEQRGSIGAIVRSSPVSVQYGDPSGDPKIVIFITTTDGMLHAIDDETGDELWAIVMPEAYPHLAEQYDNPYTTSPWWGVDGSITTRVVDNNTNGIIEETNSDKVLLYISGGMSMRRWFILDVTRARESSDQAKLVKRGMHNATKPKWDELGLAIAPMVPLNYRLKDDAAGVTRLGMIYANGWDPGAEFSYSDSTMGRGLSLYDANTGQPLWRKTKTHGGPNMNFAFATQPTTVDLDGDGYTDLIYAIDINAQIWRFNVKNNAVNTPSLITGGMLTKLGKNTTNNRRRAYKRIDASVINTATERQVILAVGTGDRMNPLSDTDQDRLYVIRDKTASSGARPTTALTENDFLDVTDNTIGEGSDSAKKTELGKLATKSGWYIDLPKGEQKAISAPLISAGVVNFPVYKTGVSSSDPCKENNTGSGLLYRMNILDATPVANYDATNPNLTKEDRYTEIRGAGIPGDVGFHTSPTGIKTLIVNRDPIVSSSENELHGDAAGYWFTAKDE